MGLQFLKTVPTPKPQSAMQSDVDIIDLLIKNMAGYEAARSHETVHASDVTKEGFCPRQFILLDRTGKTPDAPYVSAAMRATFDMGKVTAKQLVEQWAGDHVVGNWECRRCEKVSKWTEKPKPGCEGMGKCDWEYEEVKFVHSESQISGSLDAFFKLGGPKVMMAELKIIKPEEFEKIVAPLGEHKARTQLYLRLMAESNSIYKHWVNLDRARVLYVSRGYGKTDPGSGQIIPFREFEVLRNDAAAQVYIDRGMEVAQARKYGTIPINKVCPNIMCTTAKNCPVRAECWGEEFNA